MKRLSVYEPSRQDVDLALARLQREEERRERLAYSLIKPHISGWKLLGAFVSVVSVAVVTWVIIVGLFSL